MLKNSKKRNRKFLNFVREIFEHRSYKRYDRKHFFKFEQHFDHSNRYEFSNRKFFHKFHYIYSNSKYVYEFYDIFSNLKMLRKFQYNLINSKNSTY